MLALSPPRPAPAPNTPTGKHPDDYDEEEKMNYLSPLTAPTDDRAVDRRALSNEGVGGLISSGLFALTTRPSNKVRTAIVRTSPTTLILVAASEAGYHGELQQVELQLHLSNDGRTEDDSGYHLPDPVIFVSNHAGGNLNRSEIPLSLIHI